MSVPALELGGALVFMRAPHMLELDWAPLVGALVVTEKSWDKLTVTQKRELARAAGEAGKIMKQRNRLESNQAVAKMQQRGLKVTRIAPETTAAWRRAAEQQYPQIRGRIVPADLFDEVVAHLAQYRSQAQPKTVSAK